MITFTHLLYILWWDFWYRIIKSDSVVTKSTGNGVNAWVKVSDIMCDELDYNKAFSEWKKYTV